jgi:hypothetical protein
MHGWGGSQNSAETIMDEAETLINNGQIEPVIIVCADNGNTPFMGSFFTNSLLNGDYADMNVDDLVDWVEANYRAISNKKSRALMGQSMGGFGAFRYGILFKDKFSIIAAHGSPINFDLALTPIAQEVINENLPGPPYFYDWSNTELFTQMIFAMSGAFTPNLSSPQTYISPQNVEFPLNDLGNLIDTVYNKWKVFDPVSYINQLTTSDSVAILFGAGSNDNLHLYPSNEAFRDTLDLLGLPYEWYAHSGTHGMPLGFKIRALEFIDSVMASVPVGTSCLAPSGQGESSITAHSALLNWTENGTATSWEIRMGITGFDTAGVVPVTVTVNPYTYANLLPATSYDWYIRSDCGQGEFSPWTGPSSFTTLQGSSLLPATLPFEEDWENDSGIKKTDGDFSFGPSHKWSFETDRQNEGRMRWGQETYLARSGSGAMTIDKHPNNGTYAVNKATLTINLSDYTGVTDLELSFWWADHNDEEQTEDKIWVRGNSSSAWIEIYDINPAGNPDHTYQYVSGLDVDQTLANANPPQSITESFQLRFGQKDNSFAPGDGLSFDDIRLTSQQVATCENPSNLSVGGITQTTAVATWTENGSATDWQLLLGTSGFDTTGLTPQLITDNPYNLTGLTAQTAYDVYVRAACDTDLYSDYFGPVSFTTLAPVAEGLNPATLPFLEDWESDNGVIQIDDVFYSASTYEWSFTSDKINEGRGRWGTNAYMAQSGNGALTMDKHPNTGTYAVNKTTLTINLSNYANADDLELSFWWADHNDEDQVNDKVWIRGSDADAWIEVFDLDPAQQTDGTFQYVSGLDIDQFLASASPAQVPTSSFQLRFGQQDNSFTPGDGLTFDNITIEGSSQQVNCDVPSGQTATNITVSGADLSWTENGNASAWEIMVDVAGFDTAGYNPSVVQSNPYAVSGLSASTDYDWYVRSVCGSGNFSDWTGPDSFTTDAVPPPPCDDPSGQTVTNISETSADLGWTENGNATTWEIMVDVAGFDTTGYSAIPTASNPYAASGLSASTNYDWYVRSVCDEGNSSSWAGPNTFMTDTPPPPPCDAPSGLSVTNITQTSASLGWTENGSAATWEIMLDVVGFDTAGYTPVTVHSNPYAAGGLTAETDYDWYVRAVCGSGSDSEWTGPDQFTTDAPPPPPSGILPFTEDWESYSGSRVTDGDIYVGTGYLWYFSTDDQNYGRARWGTNAYDSKSGNGAITMDRSSASSVATNNAVLQIDLSTYATSTDLVLSFWWADHRDENHAGDKVWVRGNNTDTWLEIYDLKPAQHTSNTFTLVSALDIDATLTAGGQSVSSTTQIAFGQADNFPTGWDGITYDDIVIEEDASVQPSSFSDLTSTVEPFADESEIFIYSKDKQIVIYSQGEKAFYEKEIEVYNIFGSLLKRTVAAPKESIHIPLESVSGYLIVRVKSGETITVSKVFMK